MINLFNVPNNTLQTSDYSNLLHGKQVAELENKISKFVGAKHAVALDSASNSIFLSLLNKKTTIEVPSILPPVVINSIINSGNDYTFVDNVNWVGNSYILANFGDYKIIDSAQKLEQNQFSKECSDDDLMIFSFYPTKPLSGCDGGIIVSNDKSKIDYFKEMSLNGMGYASNNWEREIKFVGHKMYMNTMQADIILKNFTKYDSKISKVSKIRNYYNNYLGLNNDSNHLYTIDISERDGLIKHLKGLGITCGIHYKNLHTHFLYSKKQHWNLPLSERKSKVTMSIPMHENMTLDDAKLIVDEIKKNSIHKIRFTDN
tara:strand:- start:2097 stop:3044 length:948 start_codon:yes stop_codon:yes gene_type:complete